jgi:hypothetical protein
METPPFDESRFLEIKSLQNRLEEKYVTLASEARNSVFTRPLVEAHFRGRLVALKDIYIRC